VLRDNELLEVDLQGSAVTAWKIGE
jgi:hypothetical protein